MDQSSFPVQNRQQAAAPVAQPVPPRQPGQKRDRLAAGLTGNSGNPDASRFGGRTTTHGPESDSFNENPFPGSGNAVVHRKPVRTGHTKRKRKCKRIALDPEGMSGNGKQSGYPSANRETGKPGKKIRSRSACGALPGTSPRGNGGSFAIPVHPVLPVAGKRKRSSNRDTAGQNR